MGSRWQLELIDGKGITGYDSSLAFNNSNNPAIAYEDVTRRVIRFAEWNGASWDVEDVVTVDQQTTSSSISLAFDNSGNPAISYGVFSGPNEVRFVHYNGATWDDELVEAFVTNFASDVRTSLAYDGSGNAAIAYHDPDNGDLKFANWDGVSAWDIETVDSTNDTGHHPSLVYDGSNNASISYRDDTNKNLRYANWDGVSAWDIETVLPARDARGITSLAFDGSGEPSIAFYDHTPQAVVFAHWDGVSTWTEEVVGASGNISVTGDISLAYDNGGIPAISFYNTTTDNLKFAKQRLFDTWDIAIVDFVSQTGSNNSLAFDSAGAPNISYVAATTGDLHIARFDLPDPFVDDAWVYGEAGFKVINTIFNNLDKTAIKIDDREGLNVESVAIHNTIYGFASAAIKVLSGFFKRYSNIIDGKGDVGTKGLSGE